MNVKSNMSYADWLELADEYYLAARSLQWFTGVAYPTTHAGYHALELYLKAICVHKSGEYDNNLHDLQKLYGVTKRLEPSIDSEAVSSAVEKYWNYDQPARYTSKESKPGKLPTNNSMGTDSIHALDAVAILRDLSVVTLKGLDRLVKGESDLTLAGISDPHLALHSVILFHFNKSFTPQRPSVMDIVHYSAPQWTL